MSDDLDLRGIDQRHEPNPQFRAALQHRLVAIMNGTDANVVTEMHDLVTMDLEPTIAPSAPSRNRRLVAQVILAAAAVVVVALVANRDDDATPADQPSPAVTVPSTTPPRPLRTAPEDPELLAPGTYFVDEVAGTPTPRIFVTIGAGWSTDGDGQELWTNRRHPPRRPEDLVGFIMFSRPDKVYLDACHLNDGFYPGPATTLDGLVTALMEQQGGWVDVTAPSDISIDGYPGKTFQRTVPAVLTDCPNMTPGRMRDPELDGNALRSWLNENEESVAGWYYEPGQVETLMVLDIDGTVVVINANLWVTASATDRAEFADVLDSIRIDPRPLPNSRSSEDPLAPGTYYVDEVDGTPTPRISATLDSGWYDDDSRSGWSNIAKGRWPDGIDDVTFSNPVAVYADSCHPTDGFYAGSVATVDGLVNALTEQQGGWVDVTVPSDISIDGYVGKAFQRTAPAAMSGCTDSDGGTGDPHRGRFFDWMTADGISMGHEPGQVETLWVLDLDGTVVVIRTELWPGPSATEHADFADAVLDSIRIEQT